MRSRLLPALAVAVLALSACGGGEEEAAAPPAPEESLPALEEESPSAAAAPEGEGTVVVAATMAPKPLPLTPSPGSGATALAQIGYELEKDVVGTAKVAKKTSTTCTGDLTKQGAVPCVVDYAGLKVPYTVTITSAGSIVSGYTYETTKGVLVKEALLTAAGANGGFPNWIDPRCQMEEEMLLVTLSEPSRKTCTYRRKVDPDELITSDVVLEKLDINLRAR